MQVATTDLYVPVCPFYQNSCPMHAVDHNQSPVNVARAGGRAHFWRINNKNADAMQYRTTTRVK
jgi:hypothetical protein